MNAKKREMRRKTIKTNEEPAFSMPPYVKGDFSERILGKLVQAAKKGRLYDFTQFELAVSKALDERESFLDVYGDFLDSCNIQGVHREVLFGAYLDDLQRIVMDVNIALSKRKETTRDGSFEYDEMEGIVSGICSKGVDASTNYFLEVQNQILSARL